MALLTNQQIVRFYDDFKDIEITFTKEVIRATGLKTKQIFLKCVGHQWPCVVYSSSMAGAKVLANISEENFARIKASNNIVSLRFAFQEPDKPDPLTFFVGAKITGFNPYNTDNKTLNFVSLTYTQRPPDDLIGVLGNILSVNINSRKRSEERIIITADSIRTLGIATKTSKVFIQGIPRTCIVRDISFAGAKVVVPGVAKFLVEKPCVFYLETTEQKQFNIPGKIVRYEPVEGRKDLAAIAILFDEKSVPMEYKMIINDHLNSIKKRSSTD